MAVAKKHILLFLDTPKNYESLIAAGRVKEISNFLETFEDNDIIGSLRAVRLLGKEAAARLFELVETDSDYLKISCDLIES
jgi:hypothetical protein